MVSNMQESPTVSQPTSESWIFTSMHRLLLSTSMMDEINDEADDALEDYSELIVMRVLAGEPFPPFERFPDRKSVV